MSIKKDKKTVSVITAATGILFFVLIMGIVIFSLPNTKKNKDETVIADAETGSQEQIQISTIDVSATEQTTIEDTESQINTTEAVVETTETESPVEETTSEETTEAETEEPVLVSIVAFGDNLLHRGILDYAMMENGNYAIPHVYEGVQKLIDKADISVVNQEVVIGGIGLGLWDYPKFNAPYDVANTLNFMGVDVLTGATNHCLDMDSLGLLNMIQYTEAQFPDMLLTGVYQTQEERDKTPIFEANGVKVAFLNYTYDVNSGTPQGVIVNTINTEVISADIKRAHTDADFVVVCMHWGNEYELTENDKQISLAQTIADAGADLIIGTHPHVVQPLKTIKAADGREVLCYYSLGNLVSLQHTTPTMLGGIAEITLAKDSNGVRVYDYDYDFCVTQWDALHAGCRVILWDDYTEKLAAEHGMPSFDATFSYEALKDIVENNKIK